MADVSLGKEGIVYAMYFADEYLLYDLLAIFRGDCRTIFCLRSGFSTLAMLLVIRECVFQGLKSLAGHPFTAESDGRDSVSDVCTPSVSLDPSRNHSGDPPDRNRTSGRDSI